MGGLRTNYRDRRERNQVLIASAVDHDCRHPQGLASQLQEIHKSQDMEDTGSVQLSPSVVCVKVCEKV